MTSSRLRPVMTVLATIGITALGGATLTGLKVKIGRE